LKCWVPGKLWNARLPDSTLTGSAALPVLARLGTNTEPRSEPTYFSEEGQGKGSNSGIFEKVESLKLVLEKHKTGSLFLQQKEGTIGTVPPPFPSLLLPY